MPINRVQFQKGLNLDEFIEKYEKEESGWIYSK